MKATVQAFLTNVSFPKGNPRASNMARAFVHLQDDADCHKFKVAIPHDFGLFLAKHLDQFFEDGDPMVKITLEIGEVR